MSNTITLSQPINPITSDDTFFELVGDIDTGRSFPSHYGQRAIEWTLFAERLRAAGHSITVGGPA